MLVVVLFTFRFVGKRNDAHSMRQTLARHEAADEDEDPEAAFEECLDRGVFPDPLDPTFIANKSIGIGKCCGQYPTGESCVELANSCEEYYGEVKIWLFANYYCPAYCEEVKEKPDWCPGGLLTWHVVAISVGAAALVALVITCIVKACRSGGGVLYDAV
jgi:hypothetical protein